MKRNEIDFNAMATDLRARCGEVSLAFGARGTKGTPVLLIMGYTVPGRAWVHQVPSLSRQHQVVWFDHRGCGNTEAAPGAYTMPLLAGDACCLMDHLGWRAAHVVGVSMGGMVAQELALQHPDRIRSLCLIATHAGGRIRAKLPPLRGLMGFARANIGPRKKRLDAVPRLLFPEAFLATCDRSWLKAVLRSDFGTPISPRYRLSQLAAVLRHDTVRRLHRLANTPTLVVKPHQDLLVDPAENDRLARLIPGAGLLDLPEAGHGVVRQCYRELNAALLKHFAAADQGAEG